MENYKLTIEQRGNITVFKNETNMHIEVSLIPVKPKRKYTAIMLIKPRNYVIHDSYPLDLSKICFKFVAREEVLDERS